MFLKFIRFIQSPEGDQGGGGGFTPTFDGALNSDGSFTDGWHTKAFGVDYNGPLATAKSMADVNKMIGDSMAAARAKTEGMIKVPGADAKPEDIAAYFKAIGVPDKDDGYEYKLPEGLDEKAIDKARLDSYRKLFREAGVPKAAAEKILSQYLNDELGQITSRSAEHTKLLAEEKAELGKRFPKIDETVAAAKALANRKGVPESLKKAIADGAFDPTNDARFWGADALEAFAWAALATGEDRGAGGGGSTNAANSLAAAKDIMTNKSNPKFAKYHAGDPEVVKEVTEAYRAAAAAGL